MVYITSASEMVFLQLQAYFGGAHCRMYICCNIAGATCVTGMSNLIRRSVLQEAGGFTELGKYISEDFYMGVAAVKRYVIFI